MNETRKRLIVDMDGVLADVYQQFLNMEEKDLGYRQPLENLVGKPEHEAFKEERKYVLSPGFFRTAPLMEDCVDIMKALNERYDLYIVSAAMEFPLSLSEKYAWLQEHFPFLTWKQIVFCGSKAIVLGDIIIDDHYRNLDIFKGKTILYTQPHNTGHSDRGHHRVNNWKEIQQLLL